MKTAKLTNVTTDEAGLVAQRLGARRVLYRDAPLLNESQVPDVVAEFLKGKCDGIIFDKGAIFDVPAYEIARKVAEELDLANFKGDDIIKVVIYNKP